MASFSLEVLMRVYDDDVGDYIEVSEDKDSLGLVEVSSVANTDGKKKVQGCVIMYPAQALLVAKAIEEVACRLKSLSVEEVEGTGDKKGEHHGNS